MKNHSVYYYCFQTKPLRLSRCGLQSTEKKVARRNTLHTGDDI